MRLLVCTQAFDPADPELGFFYGWVAALAPHYEHVSVLCLRASAASPSPNVAVYALPTSKIGRVIKAWHYAFMLRREYDAVFVHMNQEYILLLGLLWKWLGKRIYFWRNHYAGSWLTTLAAGQAHRVFYTSTYSYTARFAHAVRMPVGVDTKLFARLPEVPRDSKGILFLGRLAPSKRPDLLLQALKLLAGKGIAFNASLYGPSAGEGSYVERLNRMVGESKLQDKVRIMPPVPHEETPMIFNRHAIFVNCSPSGMYDKTLFEAAGSECMVVAASKDFAELVPPRFVFEDNNAEDLARILEELLRLPSHEAQEAGTRMHTVAQSMSLSALIAALVREVEASDRFTTS